MTITVTAELCTIGLLSRNRSAYNVRRSTVVSLSGGNHCGEWANAHVSPPSGRDGAESAGEASRSSGPQEARA